MIAKTCLLTGATSGIGEAAAIDLAAQGYELYLVARSEAKAVKTAGRIKAKTADANIHWLIGDLSRLADVRSIANEFLSTGKTIDLLFLNAGICNHTRIINDDGFEMMLAVNHLAPFLLTNLLFENLCQGTGETRIVVTASGAYKFVEALKLDDMNHDKSFGIREAYGNSKLCNIMFTRRLAEKLCQAAPDKTFTVNCFHPGFVGTGIGTQVLLGKFIMTLCRPFVRTSEEGAETGLFLATDASIKGKSGGYYKDLELRELQAHARDEGVAATLWEQSMEMVGLK